MTRISGQTLRGFIDDFAKSPLAPPNFRALAPVDSKGDTGQITRMSKKPRKIEESATPYVAKKSAETAAAKKSTEQGVRDSGDAAFKKIADKIFSERKELLHKLAQ